jgi:hypothetical protein
MAKLFFSYSHKDEDLRNELEIHLALMKHQGVISSWHDRRITAGSNFAKAIDSELESSQIILLLVSAHFLDSYYCYDKEMTRALEMHKEERAVVIPVILHPCDWKTSDFGQLQATPTDGKPVSMYANQHEAFTIVAEDIRKVATKLGSSPKLLTNGEESLIDSVGPKSKGERSSNLGIKRKFDNHEKDEFLEDSYEYIARYFEGSLQELAERNSNIKTRFKRLNETGFAAYIYDSGEEVAQCSIWYGGGNYYGASVSREIAYSQIIDPQRNSRNEIVSVTNDGYTLQFSPMGMQIASTEKSLSQQGAAEYYWSLFIRPLQK